MRTERPREYCEHCGIDFTNRRYAEKIHHSNICDHYNANVYKHRFYETKTSPEKRYWIIDTLDLDDSRTGYDETIEIVHCLIGMYRKGIYDSSAEKYIKHNDVADYLESHIYLIEDIFNKKVNSDLDDLKREYESTKRCLLDRIIKK